jgi:hypothetical protein
METGKTVAENLRFAGGRKKVFNTKVEIHVEKAESIPVNVSWCEALATCTALWRRQVSGRTVRGDEGMN